MSQESNAFHLQRLIHVPDCSTAGALQVKTIAEELGLAFLTCGFDPKWKYEEVPIMPKYRYK